MSQYSPPWRGDPEWTAGADLAALHYQTTEFIYFVQAEIGGPIKIGRSRQPSHRLKQMSTGHPDKLKLTRVVPVHESKCKLMEENIHKHFADQRVRGEWFEPTEELCKLAHAKGTE